MQAIEKLKSAVEKADSQNWPKSYFVDYVLSWCNEQLQTASVEQPLERQEGDGVWKCKKCGWLNSNHADECVNC